MKFKILSWILGATLAFSTVSPALARNGLMGGAPRFIPNNNHGFHGGYGEHNGFNRNFGHGPGFGFYSYPYTPFYALPCPYRFSRPDLCYSYQYGY